MCLLLSFSKPNKILKSIKLLKQIINFCCKEILKKKKLKHFLENEIKRASSYSPYRVKWQTSQIDPENIHDKFQCSKLHFCLLIEFNVF